MRALPLLLLAGLFAAAPAHAQTSDPVAEERAKELYENGRILYEEGRYEEAILAWEEAYSISKRARLQFNLANAHERLGNLKKALDALYAYQAFAKAEERELIERRIRTIEDRMATEAPDPVPQPVPVVGPQPVPEPAPRPPRERGGVNVPAIALIGVGAAAIGTGAVFGASSSSAKGRALDLCVDSGGDLLCPAEADADLKSHRSKALLADIGFAAGALAGGTGVALLAIGGGKKTDNAPSATLRLGLGRLGLTGRF
jgi:tetratricopeptide (TPR) repeat protein